MAPTFVASSGGSLPQGALSVAFETSRHKGGYQGNHLYVARVNHEGSLIPGKFHERNGVAYIPYGGQEHYYKDNYEVLTGRGLVWVEAKNGELPEGAFQAGHEANGDPLYVAKATINGADAVGKFNPKFGFAHIPYDRTEHLARNYAVLVQKD